MSEFKITDCNITGDNPHFGDKYVYKSHNSFLRNNPELTELERNIAKTIFENEQADLQRQVLLNSLIAIKNEGQIEQKNDSNIWKNFVSKLKENGLDQIANKVIQYCLEKAPELGLILVSGSET